MTGGERPMPGGERHRTAEEFDALLDGGASGDRRLDAVLSAARGPARPHELATSGPWLGAAATGAAPRARRVLARLGAATVITKVATGAVGAAVIGAAAVAGATHRLPGQTHRHAPPVAPSTSTGSSAPSPDPSSLQSSTASSRAATGSRSPSATSTTPTTPTTPTTSPVTSPSTTAAPSSSATPGAGAISALCRVWLSLPAGSDGVRRQPRFLVLIRAAGGLTAVDAFCRGLPTPGPSGLPSVSGVPGTSGVPTPGGVPTTRSSSPGRSAGSGSAGVRP